MVHVRVITMIRNVLIAASPLASPSNEPQNRRWRRTRGSCLPLPGRATTPAPTFDTSGSSVDANMAYCGQPRGY